jgi:hypothetical protein
MAPNEAREVVDLCDSSPETTKKRKGAATNASSSMTSAKRLLEVGPEAIVQSAGEDSQQLQDLISLATELKTHAEAALAKLKRQATQCECGKKSTGNCDTKGCDLAVCDGDDCRFKCYDCENTLCQDHTRYCNFDDGKGGEGCGKGCGKPVCEQCLATTPCERDDVGGCEDCSGNFECADCDICHSFYGCE